MTLVCEGSCETISQYSLCYLAAAMTRTFSSPPEKIIELLVSPDLGDGLKSVLKYPGFKLHKVSLLISSRLPVPKMTK